MLLEDNHPAARTGLKNGQTWRSPVALLCCALLLLAACAERAKNENAGTAIGAVVGGVASSFFGKDSGKVVAVLIGAGLGAVIGNRVGAMLDDREKQAMAEATQQAAENGRTNERVAWATPVQPDTAAQAPAATDDQPKPTAAAPQTSSTTTSKATSKASTTKAKPASVQTASASGWVIPKSDTYQKGGTTCRDMTQVAVKNGQEVSDDVTMCRQVADNGKAEWVIP